MDGYDYKQPEDTVRGFNEYSSSLKPVGEVSVCTAGTPCPSNRLVRSVSVLPVLLVPQTGW